MVLYFRGKLPGAGIYPPEPEYNHLEERDRGLTRPFNPVKAFMVGQRSVMVDQHGALAVTTRLTEMLYLVPN